MSVRIKRHRFIAPSTIRTYVNERGRRISGAALLNIDAFIQTKLDLMIKQHNGGKKTIDVETAAFCGVKP